MNTNHQRNPKSFLNMKKLLYLICIACTLALYSCGTTKAYVGARQEKASLATINQGNNKLTIKNRKTKESALLIQVDSISVGDYFKGYPKHCDILPGTHTVEIRHFQQWNDNQAGAAAVGGVLGGAIGGVIAGSIAESNSPHKHYLITFDAVAGETYNIMAVTDPKIMDVDIYVTNAANEERVKSSYKLKEEEKK